MSENTIKSFYCKVCDYKCSNAWNFKQHNKTRKHIKNTTQNNLNNGMLCCNVCNKVYNTRSGLWKHNKTCKDETKIKDEIIPDINKIEKQNTNLLEQNATLIGDLKRLKEVEKERNDNFLNDLLQARMKEIKILQRENRRLDRLNFC